MKNTGEMKQIEGIKELPNEVLMIIFSFFNIHEIPTLAKTRKRFNRLLNLSTMWRTYFERDFPEHFIGQQEIAKENKLGLSVSSEIFSKLGEIPKAIKRPLKPNSEGKKSSDWRILYCFFHPINIKILENQIIEILTETKTNDKIKILLIESMLDVKDHKSIRKQGLKKIIKRPDFQKLLIKRWRLIPFCDKYPEIEKGLLDNLVGGTCPIHHMVYDGSIRILIRGRKSKIEQVNEFCKRFLNHADKLLDNLIDKNVFFLHQFSSALASYDAQIKVEKIKNFCDKHPKHKTKFLKKLVAYNHFLRFLDYWPEAKKYFCTLFPEFKSVDLDRSIKTMVSLKTTKSVLSCRLL